MRLALVILLFSFVGQQATECNLEDEVVKYLGGEIKFEIDQYGLDLIETAATGSSSATAVTAWSATIGDGQEWLNIQGPLYSDVYRKAA